MVCDESALPLAERMRRGSDRICNLILYTDLDWIDIEIEINRLREVCLEESPEKIDLFEGLYSQRFERIWNQWRGRQE